MKKTLSVKSENWYYPLIAFSGFFGMLIFWGYFGSIFNWFSNDSDLGIVVVFSSSILVPVISLILIHKSKTSHLTDSEGKK